VTTRSPWLPVPGRPDLEAASSGKVRRVHMVRDRKTMQLVPHRTKRIVLSLEEIAALGAEVIQAIRSLFEKKDDAPVENDLGKIPGPAARAPEKKR
jgi:hypothetical protein